MNIRPARMVESFDLLDILLERHPETIYAREGVSIDEPLARKVIAHHIQRSDGTNDGATFLRVAADESDKPVAFIMGHLARVYIIGDKLQAVDCFLIGRKDVSANVLDQLLDTYLAWATSNEKVYDVQASWTDILPQTERFDAVYRRKGFQRCGAVYRRLPHAEKQGELAA